ncbi:MAG: Do family serine endopeptidase [Pseudomonadota bacterium]
MMRTYRSKPNAASRLAGLATAAVIATGLATLPAVAQRIEPGVNAPKTFADVVEQVKGSVVSISVRSGGRRVAARTPNRGQRRGRGAAPFPDLAPDHPLNEFFRNLPGGPNSQRRGQRRRSPLRQSQGSGFVISADGYVVTNNHVIDKADQIQVKFGPREEYDAELVGTDPRTDLALLKIKSDKTFTPVKFAEDVGRVGDWVVAVGNPFGLGGTVTVGVVSALARDIGSGPYDFIQIDAAVNRGNSGGPTFNLKGEVIGVNTAIYSPSGGNVGIAFAVPASTAQQVIDELKRSGSVKRGWLGVRIQNVTEDVAASLGLSEARGALINDVTADGPAEAGGLQAGDAIIEVNGERINDSRDLARKVAELAPNTTAEIKVRRGADDRVIRVKLGTFPSGTPAPAKPEPKKPENKSANTASISELGLKLATLTEPRGQVKTGVVITEVDGDSNAAEKGLSDGDIIVQVNSQNVETPSAVVDEVDKAKRLGRPAVLLTVQTSSGRRLVAVQFKKS